MPKEIKVLLKEARKSFKQHEYLETMKKCKKILKDDKNNYTALILLAAAMQELDEFKSQVELVFQKAIEIQPNNSLAWQGLVAHYEKGSDDNETCKKLAAAYCKLLQLDSDFPKFVHFLTKISEIVLKIKDDKLLSEVLDTLSTLRELSNEERISLIDKTLAWVLTEYSNHMNINKHLELFETVLASVIKDTDVVSRQEYYRKYLQMLYNGNKFTLLLTQAQEMYSQFPQDPYSLDWMCRVYYEEIILNENELTIDITQFYEPLLKLNTDSESGLIAKAVYLKCTNNLVNSRECLNRAISLNTQSFCAWFMLSQVYYKLYCWEEVENTCRQALKLIKYYPKDICHKIKLILIEAMSRNSDKRKLKEAQQMCEELLKFKSSAQLQLIRFRIDVSLDQPDAIAALNNLESRDETKLQALIIKALHLKKLGQLEAAINVLELALENSEAWLLFGKIYWDLGDYNHSLMAFLNGVQVDRHNWECMVYLGHYYREYGNDIERSRKCYHAALQINPNSEEAGIGLSTAYRLLKNTEANIQLLQRVTMQGTGSKWAWLQLGLQHLDQNDPEQAIKALQHVIRADPNDNHSWESLADAYLMRGAYTSALKSYQRALQLSPGSLYPMIQLGNIKLLIGQYKEAKEDFENILRNNEQYIPALKGLAQACLGLMTENIAKQFLGRARENLQQAADNLTDAILIRSDLSCNWKLLGDVCYKTASMSQKYCYLNIKPILMKYESANEYVEIKGDEILTLSIRCFCRALSLTQNSALLWHDLTCCYLMQMQHDSADDDVAVKCLAAAKQAVKLCPQSWIHWNILGVICMFPRIKNCALAQHCFIMAIDREPNNAIAWSNLGTLYLHLGDIYKANEAFSRSQRADPSYINSWIGQGLIAEKSMRKEAIGLFQHSTQLGYHNQAALGYAHWVLNIFLNPEMKEDPLYIYFIKNIHAVSTATDVLNWYTEHEPNNVYARNTYGLLLERQKLYNSAVEQFIAALELCEDKQVDMISLNLARVLLQIGKYDEAVKLCKGVKCASFNSQCHLALSLFKAKQYEESYNTYESVLHWLADTDTDKANVLCAMAAIAYIFQGPEAVKTLLFQCIQIKPPMIAGFLATAALGILHGDFNLTSLVLKELKPFEDHHEYGHHAVTLSAYYHIVQDDLDNAIRIFTKAIHRHPDDIKYWIRLVRILLLDTNLTTFYRCAQKALILSRNTSMTDIVYVACASTYSHFGKAGLRQAQKNVFTYPANAESWASFIAALPSTYVNENSKINGQWISSLISVIRSQLKISEYMSQWLLQNTQEIF